ncbi:MAG: hypothetical protein HXM19_06380 [Gemella morbillorum]|nr:hypothetical protein [Gemella morbillorum]
MYLGYIIFGETVLRIIQIYLGKYDLSNAAVYAFCASGSSSIDKSISDFKRWYLTLNIVGGK